MTYTMRKRAAERAETECAEDLEYIVIIDKCPTGPFRGITAARKVADAAVAAGSTVEIA